jgi:hypothetical protein
MISMADLYPSGIPLSTRRHGLIRRILTAIFDEFPERALNNQTEEVIPGIYLANAERFLDGFLLNYFHELIRIPTFPPIDPWRGLCAMNPWMKRMPELYERVSGLVLTQSQLNYVAGILYERLEPKQKALR